MLHFRGRGTLFASMLLVQLVPFQLLMIPLYVMIVRSYGLADTYLGMILPFAINSTAVFIFRQFFLQLPEDLFDAARIDGAGELRILWSIALPLVRPALLTVMLLTFIGPWNEFLWPFLITKDSRHAAARGVAGQLPVQRGRPRQQPVRRDPRRRRRAGRPGGRAVRGLPAALHLVRPRLRREGLTVTLQTSTTVPYTLTRLGVVMSPEPGDPLEELGVLNPASGRTPDGRLYLLPRLVAAGNVSRVGLAEVVLEDGVPVGVERRGVVLAPDEGWERGANNAGVEDPRTTWVPVARPARHDVRRVRPARPAAGPRGVRRTCRSGAGSARCSSPTSPTSTPTCACSRTRTRCSSRSRCPDPQGRPAYAMLHRPMWDLGWFREGETVHLPAGITDERPGIWISYVPVDEVLADVRALVRPRDHRCVAHVRVPVRGAEDRRRPAAAAGRRGLAADPPRRHRRAAGRLRPHDPAGRVRRRRDAARPGRPVRVLARTAEPILAPETDDERAGTVPNVVFPTAIEEVDGVRFVFYGMADSKIGVARLDHVRTTP